MMVMTVDENNDVADDGGGNTGDDAGVDSTPDVTEETAESSASTECKVTIETPVWWNDLLPDPEDQSVEACQRRKWVKAWQEVVAEAFTIARATGQLVHDQPDCISFINAARKLACKQAGISVENSYTRKDFTFDEDNLYAQIEMQMLNKIVNAHVVHWCDESSALSIVVPANLAGQK